MQHRLDPPEPDPTSSFSTRAIRLAGEMDAIGRADLASGSPNPRGGEMSPLASYSIRPARLPASRRSLARRPSPSSTLSTITNHGHNIVGWVFLMYYCDADSLCS